MHAPSYLLRAGSGHFGIRSTIWAVFSISQLEARSVLDLIPAPIFGCELMPFYFSQSSNIQRRAMAINRFLAGTAFASFFKLQLRLRRDI